MLLGAGDDDGMKMAGEQLQACSQLSGSPMRTQPQAKRTTSGEALHLPLAPLQNSGYGLKSLRKILYLGVTKAPGAPAAFAPKHLRCSSRCSFRHQQQGRIALSRTGTPTSSFAPRLCWPRTSKLALKLARSAPVDPRMHGPERCAVETPSAVNQLHLEANPRSAAKTDNRCVIVNTRPLRNCVQKQSLSHIPRQ